MMDRIVCWDPSRIFLVAPIATEAQNEHEYGESIFLATHHPIDLRRGQPGSDRTVSQDALLDHFTKNVGDETQITIVTGAVGTGKSHVVKWLRAKSPSPQHWHEVYIEKRQTSLKRVIETILKGLDGPRIQELKQALDAAAKTTSDLNAAKDEIRLRLAHRCAYPDEPATSPEERDVREFLSVILTDPVLMQELVRDGGPIHRITRLGKEGLAGSDDERDVLFREEDLPLTPTDLKQAAGPSQRAVVLLSRSAAMRAKAVKVLNDELPGAKADVFLPGVDLVGLFDEVRQIIGDAGKELVLYVEDFVLLHGIDRELAQVFTEPAAGRCRMRVVIAVTEGYLASGFETLRSRAIEYSLNQQFGPDIGAREGRDFVGRYLNALRQSPETLAAANDSDPDAPAPNACRACPHLEVCHDTFGATSDGYGLYPYNEAALNRFLELVSKLEVCQGRFDPREVLRHVVRDPLELAACELPARRFPSDDFGGSLDPQRKFVDVEVRTALSGLEDGSRFKTLLNFWRPGQTTEPTNLAPELHQAFGLPPVERFPTATEEDTEGETIVVQPPPPPKEFADIDAWIDEGTTLRAGRANEIRKAIFTAIVESMRYGPTGLRITTGRQKATVGAVTFTYNSVRIPSAQGGGAEMVQDFEVHVERTDTWAVLIKALLRAQKAGCWQREDLNQYLQFQALVDQWTSAILAKAMSAVDLDASLRILALTSQPRLATVANEAPPGVARAARSLACMLRGPSEEEGRTREWSAWYAVATKARGHAFATIAEQLAAAKGDGNASFLDAAPLWRSLRGAPKLTEVGSDISGTAALLDALTSLRERQAAATIAEWERTRRELDGLGASLAEAESWRAVRDAVAASVDLAHDQGLLPTADVRDDLRRMADEIDDEAFLLFRRLRTATGDDSLWELVPDPVPALAALRRYATEVESLLAVLEERAVPTTTAEPVVGPGALGAALRSLADAVDVALEASE